MLIIVEGPDGAGKSTLVGRLAVELALRLEATESPEVAVRVLHKGPPTAHPLVEYETPLVDYRPGQGRHIICDRWHLGELVYPTFLDRSTTYDVAVHRHVDMFLRARGALIVLLDPEPDVPREVLRCRRAGARDSIDAEAYERYDDLRKLYQAARTRSGAHVLTEPLQPSVSRIITTARHLEDEARRLNSLVTYVGPPRPDTLLFGEVRGVSGSQAHTAFPAFMPFSATSGHYLLSHLETLVPRVGLVNACDVDHPTRAYETLGRPLAVALGQAASKRLTYLGIKHGRVPHPQYVRRFYHRAGLAYADLIHRAATSGEDLSSWRP